MLFNVILKAGLKLTSLNTTHTNLGSRVYLFPHKQMGTNKQGKQGSDQWSFGELQFLARYTSLKLFFSGRVMHNELLLS